MYICAEVCVNAWVFMCVRVRVCLCIHICMHNGRMHVRIYARTVCAFTLFTADRRSHARARTPVHQLPVMHLTTSLLMARSQTIDRRRRLANQRRSRGGASGTPTQFGRRRRRRDDGVKGERDEATRAAVMHAHILTFARARAYTHIHTYSRPRV